MGGKASMIGTVLGALTLAVIRDVQILLHISPFFTQIVTGMIILVAIWKNSRLFDRNWKLGKNVMSGENSEAHVVSARP